MMNMLPGPDRFLALYGRILQGLGVNDLLRFPFNEDDGGTGAACWPPLCMIIPFVQWVVP